MAGKCRTERGLHAGRGLQAAVSRPFWRVDAISRYAYLAELLGGYLHEDWREEFEEPMDAVEEYVANSSAEDRFRCQRDIRQLLARTRSDEKLALTCLHLGAAFFPGGGWRRWLDEVDERLGRPAA